MSGNNNRRKRRVSQPLSVGEPLGRPDLHEGDRNPMGVDPDAHALWGRERPDLPEILVVVDENPPRPVDDPLSADVDSAPPLRAEPEAPMIDPLHLEQNREPSPLLPERLFTFTAPTGETFADRLRTLQGRADQLKAADGAHRFVGEAREAGQFELRRQYESFRRKTEGKMFFGAVFTHYSRFYEVKLNELGDIFRFLDRLGNLNQEEANFLVHANRGRIQAAYERLMQQHQGYVELRNQLEAIGAEGDGRSQPEQLRAMKVIGQQVLDFFQVKAAYEDLLSYFERLNNEAATAAQSASSSAPAVDAPAEPNLDVRGPDEYQHEIDPARRHPLNDKDPSHPRRKTFTDLPVHMLRTYLVDEEYHQNTLTHQREAYRSSGAPWRVLPVGLSFLLYLGHIGSGFSKNSAYSQAKALQKSFYATVVDCQRELTDHEQATYQAAAEKFLCEPIDSDDEASAYQHVEMLSSKHDNAGNFRVRVVSQIYRPELVMHIDAQVRDTERSIAASRSKKPTWWLTKWIMPESREDRQSRRRDKGYLAYLARARREITNTPRNLLLELAAAPGFNQIKLDLIARLQNTRDATEVAQAVQFADVFATSASAHQYLITPGNIARIRTQIEALRDSARRQLRREVLGFPINPFQWTAAAREQHKQQQAHIALLDEVLSTYTEYQNNPGALAALPQHIKLVETKSAHPRDTFSQRLINSYNQVKQSNPDAQLVIPVSMIQRSPYAFRILCHSRMGREVLTHFQSYYLTLDAVDKAYWDEIMAPDDREVRTVANPTGQQVPCLIGDGQQGTEHGMLTDLAHALINGFTLPVVDEQNFTRAQWNLRQRAYKLFLNYLDQQLAPEDRNSIAYDMVKACHYSIDCNEYTVSEQVAKRSAFLIGPYGEAANALFGKGLGDNSVAYTQRILRKAIAHVKMSLGGIFDPIESLRRRKLVYGLELALAMVAGETNFYRFGTPQDAPRVSLNTVLQDENSQRCLDLVMIPERMRHEGDNVSPARYLAESYIKNKLSHLRANLDEGLTLDQRIQRYDDLVSRQNEINQYIQLVANVAGSGVSRNLDGLISNQINSVREVFTSLVNRQNGGEYDLTQESEYTRAVAKLAVLSGVDIYRPIIQQPINDYLYGYVSAANVVDFNVAQQKLARMIGRLIYPERATDVASYRQHVEAKLLKHNIFLSSECIAQIVDIGVQFAACTTDVGRAALSGQQVILLNTVLVTLRVNDLEAAPIDQALAERIVAAMNQKVRPFTAYNGQSDAYAKMILLLGTPKQRASWARHRFQYLLENSLTMTAADQTFFNFFLKSTSDSADILESKDEILDKINKVAEEYAKATSLPWTPNAHHLIEEYCSDEARQYTRVKRLVELADRRCDIIAVDQAPALDTLKDIAISADKAYVFFCGECYFIDKKHKQLERIPLVPEGVAAFRQVMLVAAQSRTLTEVELARIERGLDRVGGGPFHQNKILIAVDGFLTAIKQAPLGEVQAGAPRALFASTGPAAEYRHAQFSEILTRLTTTNGGNGQRWSGVLDPNFSAAAPDDLVEGLRLNYFEYWLLNMAGQPNLTEGDDTTFSHDDVASRLAAYVTSIETLDRVNHKQLPDGQPRLCSASVELKRRALSLVERYLTRTITHDAQTTFVYAGETVEAVPYLTLLGNANFGEVASDEDSRASEYLGQWLSKRLNVLFRENHGALNGIKELDHAFLTNFLRRTEDGRLIHPYAVALQQTFDTHALAYINREEIVWNIKGHHFIEAYASPAVKQRYRLKAIKHLLLTHIDDGYVSEEQPRTITLHDDVKGYLDTIKNNPLGKGEGAERRVFDMTDAEVAASVLATLQEHLNLFYAPEGAAEASIYSQRREKWSAVALAIFAAIAPDYMFAKLVLGKVEGTLTNPWACSVEILQDSAKAFKEWMDTQSQTGLTGMRPAPVDASPEISARYEANAARRQAIFGTYLATTEVDAAARKTHLDAKATTTEFIPVAILYATSQEKQDWLNSRFARLFAGAEVHLTELDRMFFQHICTSNDELLRAHFNTLVKGYIYNDHAPIVDIVVSENGERVEQERFGFAWTSHRWSEETQTVISTYASAENRDAYLSKALCAQLDRTLILAVSSPMPQDMLAFVEHYCPFTHSRRGFSEEGKTFLAARIDSYLRPLENKAKAPNPWHSATELFLEQLTVTESIVPAPMDSDSSAVQRLVVDTPLLDRAYLERYQAERLAELLDTRDSPLEGSRLQQAQRYVLVMAGRDGESTLEHFREFAGQEALAITFDDYVSQQRSIQEAQVTRATFDTAEHAEYLFTCFGSDIQLIDLRCQKISELIDSNSAETNERYKQVLINSTRRTYDADSKRVSITRKRILGAGGIEVIVEDAAARDRLDELFASPQVTGRPWSIHVESLIENYGTLERLDSYRLQGLQALIRLERDATSPAEANEAAIRVKHFIARLRDKGVERLVRTEFGALALRELLQSQVESSTRSEPPAPWSRVVTILLQQLTTADGQNRLFEDYYLVRIQEILSGQDYVELPKVNPVLDAIGFVNEGESLWAHSATPTPAQKFDAAKAKFGERNLPALARILHQFFVALKRDPSRFSFDAVALAQYYLTNNLYDTANLPQAEVSSAEEAIAEFGKARGEESHYKSFMTAMRARSYPDAYVQYREVSKTKSTPLPSITHASSSSNVPSSSEAQSRGDTSTIRVRDGQVEIMSARAAYERAALGYLQDDTYFLVAQESVNKNVKQLAVETMAVVDDLAALNKHAQTSQKLDGHVTSKLNLSPELTAPVQYLARLDDERRGFCTSKEFEAFSLVGDVVAIVPEIAFYIDLLRSDLVTDSGLPIDSRQLTREHFVNAVINYINVIDRIKNNLNEKNEAELLTQFKGVAKTYVIDAFHLQSLWLKKQLEKVSLNLSAQEMDGFAQYMQGEVTDAGYLSVAQAILTRLLRTLPESLRMSLLKEFNDFFLNDKTFRRMVCEAIGASHELFIQHNIDDINVLFFGFLGKVLTLTQTAKTHAACGERKEDGSYEEGRIDRIRDLTGLMEYRQSLETQQQRYILWSVQSKFLPVMQQKDPTGLTESFANVERELLTHFSDVDVLVADSQAWRNAWSNEGTSPHQQALRSILASYPNVDHLEFTRTSKGVLITQTGIIMALTRMNRGDDSSRYATDAQNIFNFAKENVEVLEAAYHYPFNAAYMMAHYEEVQPAFDRVMSDLSALKLGRRDNFNISTDSCVVLIRCLDRNRRKQLIAGLSHVKGDTLTVRVAKLFVDALEAEKPLGYELTLFKFYFELAKVARAGIPVLGMSLFATAAKLIPTMRSDLSTRPNLSVEQINIEISNQISDIEMFLSHISDNYPLLTETIDILRSQFTDTVGSSATVYAPDTTIAHYAQYKACIERLDAYKNSSLTAPNAPQFVSTQDLVLPAIGEIPPAALQVLQQRIGTVLEINADHYVDFLSDVVDRIGTSEQKQHILERKQEFERRRHLSTLSSSSHGKFESLQLAESKVMQGIRSLVDHILSLDTEQAVERALIQLRKDTTRCQSQVAFAATASACIDILYVRLRAPQEGSSTALAMNAKDFRKLFVCFESLLGLEGEYPRNTNHYDALPQFIYKVLSHPYMQVPATVTASGEGLARAKFINRVAPMLVNQLIDTPLLLETDLGKRLMIQLGMNPDTLTAYAEVNVIQLIEFILKLKFVDRESRQGIQAAIDKELVASRDSLRTIRSYDKEKPLFQSLFMLKYGRPEEQRGVITLLNAQPAHLIQPSSSIGERVITKIGLPVYHLEGRQTKFSQPDDGKQEIASYRMACFLTDPSNRGMLQSICSPELAQGLADGKDVRIDEVTAIQDKLNKLLVSIRGAANEPTAEQSIKLFLELRGCTQIASGESLRAKLQSAQNLLRFYEHMLRGAGDRLLDAGYDERLGLVGQLKANITVLNSALLAHKAPEEIAAIPSAKSFDSSLTQTHVSRPVSSSYPDLSVITPSHDLFPVSSSSSSPNLATAGMFSHSTLPRSTSLSTIEPPFSRDDSSSSSSSSPAQQESSSSSSSPARQGSSSGSSSSASQGKSSNSLVSIISGFFGGYVQLSTATRTGGEPSPPERPSDMDASGVSGGQTPRSDRDGRSRRTPDPRR